MTIKRAEPRTALTFEEKITAAFMHYVRGITQQDIAIMMGGVNIGRVNEVCRAVSVALGNEPGVNETRRSRSTNNWPEDIRLAREYPDDHLALSDLGSVPP